jgi:N6-adenosine-specific RNA methylase IME4
MRTRVKTLYTTLVLDPPWMHGDSLGKRGAKAKYECMTIDQIKAFELPPHSKDCVLFLWRVAGMIEEAYDVARTWGFNPTKGEMVWRKLTPTGKEHFGMGYIVRWSHESCIIATKGEAEVVQLVTDIADYEACIIATKGKPKVLHHSARSLFSATVPRDENGEIIHSAKPDEFFHLVKSMYAGPRASIFERKPRPGFDCFGNEMNRRFETSSGTSRDGDQMKYEVHSQIPAGDPARGDRISGPEGTPVPARRQRRRADVPVATSGL